MSRVHIRGGGGGGGIGDFVLGQLFASAFVICLFFSHGQPWTQIAEWCGALFHISLLLPSFATTLAGLC